jgi:flagellar biosynthesis component FlhA
MEKLKAKLHSLSKDRRYMIFVGLALIFIGLIGTVASGFAVFLGFLVGAFCLLLGYYGSDAKKGMDDFKHDMMEAKEMATAAAEKTAEMAKDSVGKVEASAKKVVEKPTPKAAPKKATGKK